MTVAEYLALERETAEKHEYFKGEIYAMGGASFSHALLTGNVTRELGNRLREKPCRVLPTDLRVKVSPTGLYTYPDVVVVCGEPKLEQPGDTLLNPKLIVEVLSESTERKDRGWKFEQYQAIDSLTDFLLVAQDTPRLELFTREADGRWLYVAENRMEASVRLVSIGCELKLAEVYEKVEGLREPMTAYQA
jgi:Uma2 family endonuclease